MSLRRDPEEGPQGSGAEGFGAEDTEGHGRAAPADVYPVTATTIEVELRLRFGGRDRGKESRRRAGDRDDCESAAPGCRAAHRTLDASP